MIFQNWSLSLLPPLAVSVDLLDNLSIFFVQKVTFIYKYLAIVGDTIEFIC
jgi:hypothetical protein